MNIDVLRERARIVREIRRFFDERDFIEVETGVRIPAPAPEEHIDCPPVEGGGYLRASPEIQMKKLLAAGMDRIYQIGPCFREGEKGSRHNPEFTMIEWYRRGATYLDIRDDLVELLGRLFALEAVAKPREGRAPSRPRPRQSAALPCGNGGFATASLGRRSKVKGQGEDQRSEVKGQEEGQRSEVKGQTAEDEKKIGGENRWTGDGFSSSQSNNQTIKQSNNSSVQPSTSNLQPFNFSTLRVREAYLQYAGWDPWQGEWDQDRFDFDMATKIEPAIKEMGGGVFLMDYPPQAASLAKISSPPSTLYPLSSTLYPLSPTLYPLPSTLSIAERWEFYYDGMELANCFTELCDGEEQRKRFLSAKEARRALKESDYPIDDDFLSALPRIESAAGIALGVDRLVMVLTGMKDISAVRAEI